MTETIAPGALAQRMGLSFVDPALLTRALTHPSWAAEHGGADYQRLEFLGDSVLGLLVAEHVHDVFPSRAEGDLSAMKASVVRGVTLAAAARAAGIPAAVRVGRGSGLAGDRDRSSVLEAVFEALVAAVYLDAGLEAARAFVHRSLGPYLDPTSLLSSLGNPKNSLQELTQAREMGLPTYSVESADGPDHDRSFTVHVSVGGTVLARASGPSKQAAEKRAAAEALRALET